MCIRDSVKNVQAGAGRQRRHDQIGGGSAAEQQERPTQHSAQRTAREPVSYTHLDVYKRQVEASVTGL